MNPLTSVVMAERKKHPQYTETIPIIPFIYPIILLCCHLPLQPPPPGKILSPERLVKGKFFDYRFGLSIKNPRPPPPLENSKSRALGKGKIF